MLTMLILPLKGRQRPGFNINKLPWTIMFKRKLLEKIEIIIPTSNMFVKT